jgi:hypothetical protein
MRSRKWAATGPTPNEVGRWAGLQRTLFSEPLRM